jgi:dihydroorotate dehydrogenase (fumarate)
VETAEQVIKYLHAGAGVMMATSVVMREGPQWFTRLQAALREWRDARGVSPARIRGLMGFARLKNQSAYARGHHIETLQAQAER